MKKITQLLLTALAALSMVFSSLGTVTVFADGDAPAADEKYDIVLTKVKMKDLANWPKQTGEDGTAYTGQKLDLNSYFGSTETLSGVHFEVHKDTADGDIVKEAKTGTDGTVTFTDLPAGKYVIVENKAQSEVPGNDELGDQAAVPMEIELPVFKAEGGWYTKGENAVHVYPKNTVDKPTVDKVVNENDKHDTADLGQEKTFTITSKMPAGIADYKTLTFKDTFSEGLSYAGRLAVAKNGEAVEASAYTLTQPDVGTAGASIVVAFKPEYIATLKKDDVITIKYNAVINENAVLGAANPNDVKLQYGTNPSEGKYKETKPEENPELHTGGKKFKKQDKVSKVGLKDAKFVVKNLEGKFLKQDGNVNTWVDAQSDATVFTSGEDGTFEVKGLAYGKAGDKANEGSTDYQLVEIQAPEGYAKLTQPITFTVNATSYYKDPTAVAEKREPADPQLVDNSKVTIPQTGGIGSVAVIAAGILVVGLGLMLKRRVAK